MHTGTLYRKGFSSVSTSASQALHTSLRPGAARQRCHPHQAVTNSYPYKKGLSSVSTCTPSAPALHVSAGNRISLSPSATLIRRA